MSDFVVPPGYRVVYATPKSLLIEDESISECYIVARLTNGRLTFDVRAVDRDTSMRGTVRGRVLFKLMMTHFGSAVGEIMGDWVYGDNLDRVNELSAEGMQVVDAARSTWTGLQCIRHGFEVVHKVSSLGDPGRYSAILVRFEKGMQDGERK